MSDSHGTLVPTGRLLDGTPRTILFDAIKCIGCRQCVHACKDWNDHPRTSVYQLSETTWITMEPPVLDGLAAHWSRNSCMHCEYPACAAVCPVEAITKYEEGAVVIDQGLCIGCEYCIHACPWGVISKDALTGKAAKCTMCNDRVGLGQRPFCVQACPADALDFGPHVEMTAKAEARAGEVGGHVYGQREAGGTQVLCVLGAAVEQYGLRPVGPERYPRHRIPLGLMLQDLFTLRCGVRGKLRAVGSAVRHPRRLLYRYWPWGRV